MPARSHGHSTDGKLSPTYSSWKSMKNRCNNTKSPKYKDYGGRGITICERWSYFENFLEDMGERPKELSLDRIDNESGYSPENCRWATDSQQASNKRHKIGASGVKGVRLHPVNKKWEAYAWVNGKMLRLYYGLDFEAACLARQGWEEGQPHV